MITFTKPTYFGSDDFVSVMDGDDKLGDLYIEGKQKIFDLGYNLFFTLEDLKTIVQYMENNL